MLFRSDSNTLLTNNDIELLLLLFNSNGYLFDPSLHNNPTTDNTSSLNDISFGTSFLSDISFTPYHSCFSLYLCVSQVQPTYIYIGVTQWIQAFHINYYQATNIMTNNQPSGVTLSKEFPFDKIYFEFMTHPDRNLPMFNGALNRAYFFGTMFEGDDLFQVLFNDVTAKLVLKHNAYQLLTAGFI